MNYHHKYLPLLTTTTTNHHYPPPQPPTTATHQLPSRSQLSDAISDHETSTAMKVSLTSERNASRNALSSLKTPQQTPQQQPQLIQELQQRQRQQQRSPDPFGSRKTSSVPAEDDDAFDALVTTSSSDGNFAKWEKEMQEMQDTKDTKEQQEEDMGLPVRLVCVQCEHRWYLVAF